MNKIIDLCSYQQAATARRQEEETQADLSERFEEIVSTEEGAAALLRCLLQDYGIQETVVTLFPFLSDGEQLRIIEKAFPSS